MEKRVFEYQKYHRYFAQVTGQMEELCANELLELGAEEIKTSYRGVYFSAPIASIYKIVYTSRLITRVLAPLLTFSCHSDKYLKKTAETISWDTLIAPGKTFAINATVSNSAITHSYYAALCLKDAIADYFTKKYGKRPNVEVKNPDVRLNLHIHHNNAVISLDVSGESLHKRGYRLIPGQAPMQETLAAAIVKLSDWQGEKPLWDCMCGSGTLICEALMHYSHIPTQYLRKKFGFYNMPEFDESVWNQIRETCNKHIRPLPKGLIRGSDRSQEAINNTKENSSRLPYGDNIELECTEFQKSPAFEQGVILCNPPYGIRLSNKDVVKTLYKEFGDFLKKKCCGSVSYMYIGDTTLRKYIGLKPSRKIPLVNGCLEGQLLQIDSYRIPFRKNKSASINDED